MTASIKVRNVCLDVPIFVQREREADGWASMLLGAAFDPPRRQLVRLLDDVSFDINEGDRVAILGRNGAGKSTLLRVLNRVYLPTSGDLEVEGTCQALLNMSLGFNTEATVRENIFLRGVAMGLKTSFLREQIDPILEYAGLHDKATHRLRTLSSGQKMRLGFAISTTVQHDIMLMDEWVGTGDAEFMAKAKERMRSRVSGSKIVVLASHSVGLLRDLCTKGIVLEQGRLVHAGDITSSLKAYHDLLATLRAERTLPAPEAGTDGGALVYGCVENIQQRGEEIFLVGWFVDTEGVVPGGVVIEADGRRYLAGKLESTRRPDVMRHFGLAHDRCGFRATVRIPGLQHLRELGPGMQVFGASSVETADAPLRMASTVTQALGAEASSA